MNVLPPYLAAMVTLVSLCPVMAQEIQPQLGVPTWADGVHRREAIHRELDANHAAVRDLYTLLDATPPSEEEARHYLESQIQRFDERSAVLFGELDVADRQHYTRERLLDLQVQALRFADEAQQLRRAGHVAPAVLREAQAKALQRSLSDGSRRIVIDDEWLGHEATTKPIGTALVVEVQQLRAETAELRRELKQLRELIAQLRPPQLAP